MYSNVLAFSILSHGGGHGKETKKCLIREKLEFSSQEKIGKGICLSISTKKECDTGHETEKNCWKKRQETENWSKNWQKAMMRIETSSFLFIQFIREHLIT